MCEASSLADLTATAVPPLEDVLEVVTSDLPWESDTDSAVPPVDVASALASASLRTWTPAGMGEQEAAACGNSSSKSETERHGQKHPLSVHTASSLQQHSSKRLLPTLYKRAGWHALVYHNCKNTSRHAKLSKYPSFMQDRDTS
jgi:hypothetical protein